MHIKHIVVEKHEPGIWVWKITRPNALNALNTEVLQELQYLLEESAKEETFRVLVLTGDGEKSFVAGADILEMKDKSRTQGVEFSRLGHQVTKALELIHQPTIAAVNGFALGGGTELAIACDFILAAENAVFAQPEVGLGLIPGFGGTVRLMKFVGIQRAKELIFTGRKIDAQEAYRIGLANQVLPKKDFLKSVLKVAAEIAKNSHPAVSACKRLINEFSESQGLDYKLDAESQEFGNLFDTSDLKEGLGAFAEKRKPHFQGVNL